MRRVSFFVLLGPFLSWLVFIAMLLPKLLTGPRFDGALPFFLIALLVCYAPGVLAFLVIAGIDHLLSRYPPATVRAISFFIPMVSGFVHCKRKPLPW